MNTAKSSTYTAENRMMDDRTVLALTTADNPSEVRSNPWTIHGWRPTSAANQPAWLAICGPSTESKSNHSIQRFSNNDPRQKYRKPSAAIRIIPNPTATIRWNSWNVTFTGGRFLGSG